jgi:hypothetical protein
LNLLMGPYRFDGTAGSQKFKYQIPRPQHMLNEFPDGNF